MKNQHASQKKSNRGKAQSLLDDGNQLCGTEDIKCTGRQSLSLTIMNNFAVLTKWAVYPWRWITVLRCRTIFWREGTVFPCYEEQLCGAEDIICWEARSINNDEEQLCGAEEIKYPENTVYPWRRKIFIYAVLTESNAEGASLQLTMKNNWVVHKKKIKYREGTR